VAEQFIFVYFFCFFFFKSQANSLLIKLKRVYSRRYEGMRQIGLKIYFLCFIIVCFISFIILIFLGAKVALFIYLLFLNFLKIFCWCVAFSPELLFFSSQPLCRFFFIVLLNWLHWEFFNVVTLCEEYSSSF
jgi:hypothetical protein